MFSAPSRERIPPVPCVATIGGSMTRRRFMAVAAGAAAWPWMARAQPATKAAQIGLLYPGFEAVTVTRIAALREGLRAVGYADADRAEILVRASEGDPSRLGVLTADL